jgi:hypothetical protein
MMMSPRDLAAPGFESWACSTTARIIVSLNRDIMLAAQNASAASSCLNEGFGYSVFHVAGSNTSASMLPIEGSSDHLIDIQSRW